MKSMTRFTRLVQELNKTDEILNAKEWSKRILNENPTSSDVLITQTHLNVLFYLGNVSKIGKFKGKSPRYSYKRENSLIKLGKFIGI